MILTKIILTANLSKILSNVTPLFIIFSLIENISESEFIKDFTPSCFKAFFIGKENLLMNVQMVKPVMNFNRNGFINFRLCEF